MHGGNLDTGGKHRTRKEKTVMSDFEEAEYDPDFGEVVPTVRKGRGGYFYNDVDVPDFDSAKAFYARVLKDYAEGAIPRDRARTIGYLLAGYLSYFKLEYDRELIARVEAVEKRLEDQESAKRIGRV